ncbi:hypothetical protein I302_105400 [Kwoniella bestiolae CBS 10118]|uniref:Uncharacterized protein n=1 Tax=Kwoniella bestiolae CBS 10118 TaxID=1296100 RepID=A0A1B9FT11_9TREE|nr:hypothetical protein I302_08681 [Kwoniella bestiolae CBS 10118]OCF21902.1 hypothetical protein I302_08681 [Kwoniella bestiolae CBS 10118]
MVDYKAFTKSGYSPPPNLTYTSSNTTAGLSTGEAGIIDSEEDKDEMENKALGTSTGALQSGRTLLVDLCTAYSLDSELRIVGSDCRHLFRSRSKSIPGKYDLFVEMYRSEIHSSIMERLESQIEGRDFEKLPALLAVTLDTNT